MAAKLVKVCELAKVNRFFNFMPTAIVIMANYI